MNKFVNFLLGMVAGTSIGMFFAPKKGRDLRSDLSKSDNRIKDLGNALTETSKDIKDVGIDLIAQNHIVKFSQNTFLSLRQLGSRQYSKLVSGSRRLLDKVKKTVSKFSLKSKNMCPETKAEAGIKPLVNNSDNKPSNPVKKIIKKKPSILKAGEVKKIISKPVKAKKSPLSAKNKK